MSLEGLTIRRITMNLGVDGSLQKGRSGESGEGAVSRYIALTVCLHAGSLEAETSGDDLRRWLERTLEW